MSEPNATAERPLANIKQLADWVDAHTRVTGRGCNIEVRGVFNSRDENLVFTSWVPVLGFEKARVNTVLPKLVLRVLGGDNAEHVVINPGIFYARLLP